MIYIDDSDFGACSAAKSSHDLLHIVERGRPLLGQVVPSRKVAGGRNVDNRLIVMLIL